MISNNFSGMFALAFILSKQPLIISPGLDHYIILRDIFNHMFKGGLFISDRVASDTAQNGNKNFFICRRFYTDQRLLQNPLNL